MNLREKLTENLSYEIIIPKDNLCFGTVGEYCGLHIK